MEPLKPTNFYIWQLFTNEDEGIFKILNTVLKYLVSGTRTEYFTTVLVETPVLHYKKTTNDISYTKIFSNNKQKYYKICFVSINNPMNKNRLGIKPKEKKCRPTFKLTLSYKVRYYLLRTLHFLLLMDCLIHLWPATQNTTKLH